MDALYDMGFSEGGDVYEEITGKEKDFVEMGTKE
jgi:hypothetical protein